jgi:hypothetical protein
MTTQSRTGQRACAWPVRIAATGALGLLLLLLFGLNMRRGLNHDEHQFVGSAVLLARAGLRPYADFAYFHVPGQTLLYAALFAAFDHFLLAARSAAVLSSWLGLALLLWTGLRFAPFVGGWARLGYALAGVVTFMASPIFVHTSGRAWNHDLPLLLTLAALLTFLHANGADSRGNTGQTPAHQPAWIGATGALLGLAAATRLSYAFLAPPFVGAIWLWGGGAWRARLRLIGWLAAGGLIGLAPIGWALLIAPDGFLFGNVVYNLRLNPLYYASAGGADATAFSAKIASLVDLLLSRPANLVTPLLFVVGLAPALPRLRQHTALPLKTVLLLLPFALFGAMSATPSQSQYYYLLYPLLMMGFFFAVALWPRRQTLAAAMLVVGAAISVAATAVAYAEGAEIVFQPDRWYPQKVHSRGHLIAELAGRGRVLTLAPIHALEGGLPIYPEFVTGPLAWRVAHLVAPEERARFGLVAEPEMAVLLAAQPPRAVLTGFEADDAELEAVLLAYATEHHFTPVALPDEGVLWLASLMNWNDAIQLGAVALPDAPVAAGDELFMTLYLLKSGPIDRNLNVLVRVVDAAGNEAARSEGWPYGAPTQSWQQGVTWPDGHRLTLDPHAAPGLYRVEVSFYDPETLAPFGDLFTAGYVRVMGDHPAPVSTPLATFAQGLDLMTVDAGAQPWRPGDHTATDHTATDHTATDHTVTLTWRPAAALDAAYTGFVHLLAPDGQLIAQHDQPPQQGFYPSDRWLAGYTFQDKFVLTLPADAPAGEYRLVIGWYDPATGQRLPLRAGETSAGDAFQAVIVQVE